MFRCSLNSTRKPRKPRLSGYRAACAVLAMASTSALLGCSTPGGGSTGWTMPWSKSAVQKPVTYEQLAKEHQQRKISSPALGLDQNMEPNAVQTAAAAIGAKMKSGTDKIASSMSSNSETSSDSKRKSGWPFSKRDEVSADFYVSIAQVHEQGKDTEEATAQYEKALTVDPKHLDALLCYAHMQDRLGQLDKAIDLYQRAIKAHPRNPSPANDLGLCYARQAKYEEALVCLTKAIELKPDGELYRNNIATVLVKMDRVDDAVLQIAAVYGEAVARYNVALMLNGQGKREAAIEQFAAAVHAKPDLSQAQEWLAQLTVLSEEEQLADANANNIGPNPVAVASPVAMAGGNQNQQLATPTSATFETARAPQAIGVQPSTLLNPGQRPGLPAGPQGPSAQPPRPPMSRVTQTSGTMVSDGSAPGEFTARARQAALNTVMASDGSR